MAILHPQNLIFATVTILAKAITPSRTGPPRFLVTILRPQNPILVTVTILAKAITPSRTGPPHI